MAPGGDEDGGAGGVVRVPLGRELLVLRREGDARVRDVDDGAGAELDGCAGAACLQGRVYRGGGAGGDAVGCCGGCRDGDEDYQGQHVGKFSTGYGCESE